MNGLLGGGIPAAIELEDVESGVDVGGAVEDDFVAEAVVEALEAAVGDEVIEEGAAADVFVALPDGEGGLGGERDGAACHGA